MVRFKEINHVETKAQDFKFLRLLRAWAEMLDTNGTAQQRPGSWRGGVARMTLEFNLSDDMARVMEVAAATALLWLLTCNSSHGSRHEHHLLSKDFIPGPVLGSRDKERLSN